MDRLEKLLQICREHDENEFIISKEMMKCGGLSEYFKPSLTKFTYYMESKLFGFKFNSNDGFNIYNIEFGYENTIFLTSNNLKVVNKYDFMRYLKILIRKYMKYNLNNRKNDEYLKVFAEKSKYYVPDDCWRIVFEYLGPNIINLRSCKFFQKIYSSGASDVIDIKDDVKIKFVNNLCEVYDRNCHFMKFNVIRILNSIYLKKRNIFTERKRSYLC